MGKIVGISVQQIEDRLIDVRSPREFWECHAPMALNIPLETLNPHAITMALNVSEFMPIHIICGDGVGDRVRAVSPSPQFPVQWLRFSPPRGLR